MKNGHTNKKNTLKRKKGTKMTENFIETTASIKALCPSYEKLAERYEDARNRAGNALFEMAKVCTEAKEKLGDNGWLEWLKDSRVNLQETQAKKFAAIGKHISEGQSTDFLNKQGVEKAYLLTRIKDEDVRKEFAGQIIDVDFTVKETRQAVKLVANKQASPSEAVEKVQEMKSLPKTLPNPKQTVSLEKYEGLKTEYDKALAKIEELKKQLAELSQNTDARVNQETKKEEV